MKHLYLLSLILLVNACDVSTGNRRQIFNTPNGNAFSAYPTPAPTSGVPIVGGSTPTPSTSATSGAGFETCSLTPKGSNGSVGQVGVCQSSSDETQIKFQTTAADSSVRTCLIPTYKDSSGSSVYIGQPQCTLTEANKIYLGKLYKNRTGFESYPLNGVIIMKENIMSGYFSCMNAYTTYQQPQYCTADPLYASCYQQNIRFYPNAAQLCCNQLATIYRDNTCNTYKNTYGSQYLDIRLRY
jgi:hypothetical protein